MKSFTEHELDREQLDEELDKKVKIDEATAGDFLLGLGVAGGLLALKKGWDKWGKGSKLHRSVAAKFGTAQMKRDADQAAADKDDIAQADKERSAKADTAGLEKDSEGNLKNQKDAQAYKDKTKKAPSGWETSPEDSPGKGEVWKAGENDKWKETKAKLDAKDAEGKAKKDAETKADRTKSNKAQRKQEKGRKAAKKSGVFGKGGTSKKSQKKAARKASIKKATGSESFIPDCISILSDLTEDFTKEDRTQLLEELVLEETMTITESNELQAIMALDDVGISAEINRKGEVTVKKKDLKKAQKALKKSFKKGGEPKLVGEGVLEDGTTEMTNQYKNDTPGQVVTEALKPLDKSVIDAFYYRKEKAGKVVSTDGDTLMKNGMGGQTIAQWLKPSGKIAISAVTDVKSTESILKYMKKSIPKGNFDKRSYKKFFGEELQRTAYELVSEARKKAAANKLKWEQE